VGRLAELKKRVPITVLLKHYGWSGWEEHSRAKEWNRLKCPFHDDRNPSASVKRETNRFNCFTCGVRGDIIDIVMQVEGFRTVRDAADWIEQRF